MKHCRWYVDSLAWTEAQQIAKDMEKKGWPKPTFAKKGRNAPMVSVDHFGYELRRQLREAAADGASELPISSHDLCRSIRDGAAWQNACCEAMEQEVQEGDIVVQDKNGLGMFIRYRLPRRH